MGQLIDRGDIIDILEESVTTGWIVAVEMRGGQRFTDRVRDVITKGGEDFVEFREQGRYGVSEILNCARGQPVQHL